MCIVCIEINKGVISTSRAKELLYEISNALDPEHYAEVSTKIWEKGRKEENKHVAKNAVNFSIVDLDDDPFADWDHSPFDDYDYSFFDPDD